MIEHYTNTKTDACFVFAVCQHGAEAALKAEMAKNWPPFHFAYSRRGFVTYKGPGQPPLRDDFDLHSVFARTYGFSLGRVCGESAQDLSRQVWQLVGDLPIQQLHVWERDPAPPSEKGFEPGPTPLANEIGQLLLQAQPGKAPTKTAPLANSMSRPILVNQTAEVGDLILDCVLTAPNEWWIGYHRSASMPSRWPGGVFVVQPAANMISRAYLKMKEALAWSRMPIQPGDLFAEIGSSPGGACQALLEAGLTVWGIDPAEMEPWLLEQPRFTHLRKRVADMKRREFREVKWLAADSNVAAQTTLDDVEAIVTHRAVNLHGMLLTIKLLNWEAASDVQEHLQRIRGWGYEYVRARQLAYNRQEYCVAAFRRRSMRKRYRKQEGERLKAEG